MIWGCGTIRAMMHLYTLATPIHMANIISVDHTPRFQLKCSKKCTLFKLLAIHTGTSRYFPPLYTVQGSHTSNETHENSLNFANSLKDVAIPRNFIKYINSLEFDKDFIFFPFIWWSRPHSKQTFSMVKNAHKVVEQKLCYTSHAWITPNTPFSYST